MEPNLLRDAVIVLVLAALLLAARVPWRTVVLILGLVAAGTVALDALITEFMGND